jgi:hypothetical protein
MMMIIIMIMMTKKKRIMKTFQQNMVGSTVIQIVGRKVFKTLERFDAIKR